MTEHRFAVRVRPGARQTRVGGRWAGSRGPALSVRVTAAAVDGRANDAVCRALADALGLSRGQVSLVAGARGRDKLVAVSDPPADIAERVAALLDAG